MEKCISLVTDVTFLASSTDRNPEVLSLFIQLFTAFISEFRDGRKIRDLRDQINILSPSMEYLSLAQQIFSLMRDEDLNTESEWKMIVSLITQIVSLVSSMDLDLESELISLIKKVVFVFNSKPNSDSDSESELVSLITQTLRLGISVDSDSEATQESELRSLISQLVSMKPEPELTSLIRQIISRFRSMNWEPLHFVSVYPQAQVILEKEGNFRVLTKDVQWREAKKGECHFGFIEFWRSATQNHFHCLDCNGKNHEEYDKVPDEVKHPLHPKHSLQPFMLAKRSDTRECYCCDEDIGKMFYYCSACDYAINLDCVKKPPRVLSIDHPKWHDHPLALFPSQASLTCNLCAITHSRCPFYVCPPCDFVVHQKCLSLPKVIKISRHPQHRISFTPSFDQGDRCCRVCQRKINNDYGGYSCIKDGCSYVAHSRCATQTNVWDGEELEGKPEEIEEEVMEPFVRISDGIIQHFSHQQHHLRLDENASREYDESTFCQACIMPIYFGNFYSCLECEILIHEKCANLSRQLYFPIHAHPLTLVGGYDGVVQYNDGSCSACSLMCTCGFFYKCGKEECFSFKLHVQCATISESLVHESHIHPLFLTSKPGEKRGCSVCKFYHETFNCVEGECDFSLCFECATIPHTVRYKHDKHILTLSYGEETSTMTYWCEVCEREVNPKMRFYKCDEYCCITLHVECLIGNEIYVKPGSTLSVKNREVRVLPNNQHMSRPFCVSCEDRCPDKIIFQYSEFIFCSMDCLERHVMYTSWIVGELL